MGAADIYTKYSDILLASKLLQEMFFRFKNYPRAAALIALQVHELFILFDKGSIFRYFKTSTYVYCTTWLQIINEIIFFAFFQLIIETTCSGPTFPCFLAIRSNPPATWIKIQL